MNTNDPSLLTRLKADIDELQCKIMSLHNGGPKSTKHPPKSEKKTDAPNLPSCNICLDTLLANHANVAIRCCSKEFHQRCLEKWFGLNKKTCPTCRKRIWNTRDCFLPINLSKKVQFKDPPTHSTLKNPPPLDVPTNSNQDPIETSSKLCTIILGINCDISSKKFMKKYWGQLTSEHRSTLLAAKNIPGDEFSA